MINWGDGNAAQPATLIPNGSGGYDVIGTHAYGDDSVPPILPIEAANVDAAFTIVGTDGLAGGLSDDVIITDPPVVGSAGNFTGIINQNTGIVTTATFTDPAGVDPLNHYIATIAWGDGTAIPGTITVNNGVYSVSGSHIYVTSGPENVTTTIFHDSAPNALFTGEAFISAAPTPTPSQLNVLSTTALTTNENLPTNFVLGSFTDPTGLQAASSYTATINWGDGSATQPATLVPTNSGGYNITGIHTYPAESSQYTATVSIVAASGETVQPPASFSFPTRKSSARPTTFKRRSAATLAR